MKILLDCDPGLDDAVALLAILTSPRFEILAITTVAGNVSGEQTALNARIIRTLAEAEDVPVHAGASRPLLREPVTAEDFHGTTGLGGVVLPEPGAALSQGHAVNALIDYIQATRGDPLTLIMTGPMTNVAIALRMAPEIKTGLKEIILMAGGSKVGGNITPYAEFNVFADPHAASIVFKSGVPIRCLSLDVTHNIRTTEARLEQVRSVGTDLARYAADFLQASCELEFKATGIGAAPLHDPSTVIALAAPDLFQGERVSVDVIVEPGERFGHTDITYTEEGSVLWYQKADIDGVYETLCSLIGGG